MAKERNHWNRLQLTATTVLPLLILLSVQVALWKKKKKKTTFNNNIINWVIWMCTVYSVRCSVYCTRCCTFVHITSNGSLWNCNACIAYKMSYHEYWVQTLTFILFMPWIVDHFFWFWLNFSFNSLIVSFFFTSRGGAVFVFSLSLYHMRFINIIYFYFRCAHCLQFNSFSLVLRDKLFVTCNRITVSIYR